jgi:hypothetical protein
LYFERLYITPILQSSHQERRQPDDNHKNRKHIRADEAFPPHAASFELKEFVERESKGDE